jgi:hypothetical protein
MTQHKDERATCAVMIIFARRKSRGTLAQLNVSAQGKVCHGISGVSKLLKFEKTREFFN